MHYGHILLLGLFLQIHVSVYAAISIPANGTQATQFAFTVPVTAKLFDPLSGAFIVGLAADGGEYALSIATEETLQFQPIAQNTLLTNEYIEMLALAEIPNEDLGVNTPAIGAVLLANDTFNSNNVVTVITFNGSQVVQTVALNDATGINSSAGIMSIAGNTNYIFATVKDSNNNTFGTGNSGITLIAVDSALEGTLTTSTTDTPTGGIGNRAVPLSFPPNLVPYGNLRIPLYWDNTLKRLYLGISCFNNSTNTFADVVLFSINTSTGSLDPHLICPIAAIDGNNIVATVGANQQLIAQRLAVMHTSTGLSYLIVQGGSSNVIDLMLINQVRALPLVDDSTSADHGALANKNATLIDGVFKTPATAPGDLPLMTDPAAIVGDPANIPTDLQALIVSITDMVVVGDTVYIAVNNDTFGYVLCSQALFNADGTIARWTPWAQRATPVNAFPGINMPDSSSEHSGKVSLFAVDAVTGKIWLVEGDTNRLVGLVSWTTVFEPTSLPGILNSNFTRGCYSSLDLHHKTSLIGLNNNNYSLFGGSSTIAFARTRDETLSATSPAGTVTDFSSKQNFLMTYLPQGNIPVSTLEYTSGLQNNYFLAGTQQGLYIFCDSGSGDGFTATDLSTLDQPPFTQSSWQRAPSSLLQKAIIDLQCAEDNIYIITFDPLATDAFYNLYAIDPTGKTNINDTFDDSNIRLLATSNVDLFEGIISFNGCAVIHTGEEDIIPAAMPEQVFLATNQGMWISTADQTFPNKGLASAQDQADAEWQQIPEFQNQFFNGIGKIDTPIQHTVWPFYITKQSSCNQVLESILNQLSQAGDGSNSTPPPPQFFDPANFNRTKVTTLDPIVYFWSDGARRFFIFNAQELAGSTSKIAVIPYDTTNSPFAFSDFINDVAVNKESQFYWIRSIGDLGIILAGTNNGVISLQ